MDNLVKNLKQKSILCNLFRCTNDLNEHISEINQNSGKCCLFKRC